MSLFLMCVGIIRNNSLVGGRSRAESNPGHSPRHTSTRAAARAGYRHGVFADKGGTEHDFAILTRAALAVCGY